MNYFVVILLTFNLVMMAVFFIITKHRFSQNKYIENMRDEVSKLIADIQIQSETCIRLLEDKIAEAKQIVKVAESRLEVIKNELEKKDNEVVVLDKLMAKNSEKAKASKEKKAETIKIYTDNPAAYKNLASEQVLALHNEGLSPAEISKQTGMQLGEISLIISLDGNESND